VVAPVSRHAGDGRCQPRQRAVQRGTAREGAAAARWACVDAREGVGGADRRGEPAEERRTVEAGGGFGRSGAQGAAVRG
jgi:hypothetical protein